MKKTYNFTIKTARFRALAAFSILALLAFAGCNKEVDDDFGAGATQNRVAVPTFCPPEGEVAPGTEVHLATTTEGASIYYTTIDGGEPAAENGTPYSGAITITGSNGNKITVRAIAIKDGLPDSPIGQCVYTINDNMAATPTASPSGGEVAPNTQITLTTATEGASIYYTVNGDDPSTGSTLYSVSNKPTITVTPTTVKAIAVKEGTETSAIATFDYTLNYLTFSFVTSADDDTAEYGTVTPKYTTAGNQLEYSTDNGATWNDIASGETTESAQKILFRGLGRTSLFMEISDNHWSVNTEGKTRVTGNINTVLDYENPPASLSDYAFWGMFQNCASLIEAPALPATGLAYFCYYGVFYGCSSLTEAPALPAVTLADSCYMAMFTGCYALKKAPLLPAQSLKPSCYYMMFSGCSALEEAPALPALTLASDCYSSMFGDCAALLQPPELPAETLAESCYSGMFQGCASLEEAPDLPATTLADSCYRYMFYDCTNLSVIKCNAINISASNCLTNWTQNVSATGNFYKNPAINEETWTRGDDGIPTNWDVDEYVSTP